MTLQPWDGIAAGAHYLDSSVENIMWGWLPNSHTPQRAIVSSGTTVVIDTVSHEGILEDQGRDPVEFFARFGVDPSEVLVDAIAVAASSIAHRMDIGPHVVTGPIAIDGARPGDVLKVDVLTLERRADYGIVSNRHGKGCLPGEYPRPGSEAGAFEFVGVTSDDRGLISWGGGSVRFPLRPFLGIMGVAPTTDDPVPSVPPGRHGGNLDVNLLVEGTTLYLPVQVPEALFYVGDPHFSQGDGEVALTAFEAPLRATLRLTVLSPEEARESVGTIDRPFIETPEFWVPIGLDIDLDEAMRAATRSAIAFLTERFAMRGQTALAYLSAAADFEVSQVVDVVKGIHCCIRKSDFETAA